MEPTIIDEFRQGLTQIRTGVQATQDDLADLNVALKEVQRDNDETRKQLDKLRKTQLAGLGKPVLRAGQAVSDGCARHLAAIFILSAEVQGKLHDHRQRESLLGLASDFLGVQQRAALTTTDIPMPIIYGEEVAELVWQYGQFRRYATVYPLGSVTTKLPKLSTSPAFGVIAQSGSVGEKSPQIAFVTFTAFKSGGLVRIPSEIDADSIVPLGQFLARYIAREMARWEDTVGYLGDGTGTYGSVSGVGKKADTLGNKIQLATGKTKPSDITLADLRSVRSKVDGAALSMGTTSASHTSLSGSARVRQWRGARCEGSVTLDSMRRALLTLMPVLAAAASWVCLPRSSLYLVTCRSVMRLPGTVAASFLRRTTVEPDRRTHPGGVRQPVTIVVADRSR